MQNSCVSSYRYYLQTSFPLIRQTGPLDPAIIIIRPTKTLQYSHSPLFSLTNNLPNFKLGEPTYLSLQFLQLLIQYKIWQLIYVVPANEVEPIPITLSPLMLCSPSMFLRPCLCWYSITYCAIPASTCWCLANLWPTWSESRLCTQKGECGMKAATEWVLCSIIPNLGGRSSYSSPL
jgi:hypothetical protein